jgi:hypothetical protein
MQRLFRVMACAAFLALLAAPHVRAETKSYDDPFEQTVEVDQQRLDSLREKAGKLGSEAGGALGDVEGALGRLRGAVEEHKTIYREYREAQEETGTKREEREAKIRPLAKKLDAATKRVKELATKFDLAYYKAAKAINDKENEAELAAAHTAQGDGTPGNPLKGGVSQNDPGTGASSQSTEGKGDVHGKVLGGEQEPGGRSADPGSGPNQGDQANNNRPQGNTGGATPGGPKPPKRQYQPPPEPKYDTPDGPRTTGDGTPGNPLKGRVEKNVTTTPPAGESASGPPTVVKTDVHGKVIGSSDDQPRTGHQTADSGRPRTPKRQYQPPLEPKYDTPDGPRTAGGGTQEPKSDTPTTADDPNPEPKLKGEVRDGEPRTGDQTADSGGPKTPTGRYQPLEPIYDTSRGTPDKGTDHDPPGGGEQPRTLKGRVEKTDRNPPGGDDGPTVLKGRVEKGERKGRIVEGPPAKTDSDPNRGPGGKGAGNSNPPPLKGGVEKKDKSDDGVPLPTGAVKGENHQPFDSPKKRPKRYGAGLQYGTPQGAALGKYTKDNGDYVAFYAPNAQVGIQQTSEGFEAKGEVGVSLVQTKSTLHKGRHGSATIQMDILSAKLSAQAVAKNQGGRVTVKANWGAEAKLAEVQGTGTITFPTFGGAEIEIAGQGAVGVGAAATGDFAFDASQKGLHLKVGEHVGMGLMQSLGFTVNVKMKK